MKMHRQFCLHEAAEGHKSKKLIKHDTKSRGDQIYCMEYYNINHNEYRAKRRTTKEATSKPGCIFPFKANLDYKLNSAKSFEVKFYLWNGHELSI